jgi:hypothetical protein
MRYKAYGNTAMIPDDYRRLREALTAMALQEAESSDGARWLAVAQTCLELENGRPSKLPGRHYRTAESHPRFHGVVAGGRQSMFQR